MYTIGAFSKLSRVSARMLRHYDAIGLLRPARVDRENGYRYYDEGQLERLRRIETLKGYGFALAELPELLALEEAELAQRIHRRRLEAYGQLEALRGRLRRMEEEMLQMEGLNLLKDHYRVILLPDPPRRVLALRRTISVAQTHALFQELHAEAARRGLRRTGCTQLSYLGEEFDYGRMDVEAQMEVDGADPAVKELPGRMCAATHVGPYETVKYAYDAICAWLGEHPEYRVCGPAVERYLRDEESGVSPEEYETGVLFPVERTGEGEA